ncbi:hypothetical protein [Pectobacterium carotovorum]|uniref:Metalloprotease StcE beta-sandwich domain-containing protein n=1 Tax=Pectobacterium carotovorum TaxID=554 RepID=A0A419B1H6_PECCA|nr:hypothetical protein [Pectobacterium carotovorum]RJL55483.1 hypothetical protein D5071_00515 [Pectobacterium carotovorum]
MKDINENFIKLEFTNGKDITKEQLNDTLENGNFIYIDLFDGHWVKNIYIPDEVPFSGGVIDIVSKAMYKTTIHVYDEQYVISKGEELVILGSPTKEWTVVVPKS